MTTTRPDRKPLCPVCDQPIVAVRGALVTVRTAAVLAAAGLALVAVASWAGYQVAVALSAGRWSSVGLAVLGSIVPAWLARDAVLRSGRKNRS